MTEIDVFSFDAAQRKAISKCALFAEPVQNMPGVGQKSIDALVARGVLEVSGEHRHGWPAYKLTAYGEQVHEALWKANRLP